MFWWKKSGRADRLGAAVRSNITRHGQHVMSVTEGSGPCDGDFVYTVGNHGAGMPELLITGKISRSFAPVLNHLGKLQRDRGFGFRDGEIVSLGGKHPVHMVDAGEAGRTQRALFVASFYGTCDFALLQVICPDSEGRWPDDPACAEGFSSQRIMKDTPA
ncbi:MAG: DUF4262 domain-containing protein [Rhizomicrobium sp.]|jgi:hypothetical protein